MKMNIPGIISRERATSEKKIPISPEYIISGHRFRGGHFGRALHTIGVVAVIALIVGLSSAAFAANPAEEMAKIGSTGGTDPKGDSWDSTQQSIQLFGHPDVSLPR